MKNKIMLGAIALACIASLLVASNRFVGPYNPLQEGAYDEITSDCPMPEVPTEVPRLKVVHCDVTPEMMKRAVEEIFGFTGEVDEIPEEEGGRFGIWNPPHLFRVYSVGGVEYWNRELSGGTLAQPVLPSYEQAKEIGENILERIGMQGLTPQNPDVRITFREVYPGEVTIVPEENIEIIQYLNVGFTLGFKEFRIWGPGAKVSVGLGENNAIVHFRGFWKEVEENGCTSITVTPEQAVESLKSRSFTLVEGSMSRKATVKGIELGYYSRTLSEEQDYLSPIYLLRMVPILEDGSEGEVYHEVVPATDQSFTW